LAYKTKDGQPRASQASGKRVPWWQPQAIGTELQELAEVLGRHYFNEGVVAQRFEETIARKLGAKHAIATTSGTSAIFLALKAVGAGPGDEVIVPDLTFIATANAVALSGAKVVLVDVDPRKLTIDPDAFRKAITPRTKAVVPVHVSGRAADMTAILATARERGIAVVEDAAEGFMSAYQGRMLGTLGDVGCFSFSPNKVITTGQGGIMVTASAELANQLRMLKDQGRPTRGTGGDDLHPGLGFNFKLTDLQAAVGMAQLQALDERLRRQTRNYEIYAERLSGLDGIVLPGFDLEGREVPLWTDALVERRGDFDRYLEARGMGCRRFWRPVHTQATYRSADTGLENSSRCSARAIWLPSAFTLSDDDVHAVCDAIGEFFKR
jgi:perosamine synthetase